VLSKAFIERRIQNAWLRVANQRRLNRSEALAAYLATCFQDAAATLGAHPAQKTVLAFPANFGWLISSFHTNSPESKYISAKCKPFGLNKFMAKLAKNRAGKHTNSHWLVKRVTRKIRSIRSFVFQVHVFDYFRLLIRMISRLDPAGQLVLSCPFGIIII
jgi:hypothetical protein